MILIIDQRKGAMRDDGSNLDVVNAEYERALSRSQSGTEPSAVIHVTQDGIFVIDGNVEVEIVTVKSESELSAEKARRERGARENSHRDSLSAGQHYENVMARVRAALTPNIKK